MTDREDTSPIVETDDSRRSFMKKGALATGALALGSSAVGSAAAQETPDDETPDDATGTEGDSVLMLLPDAVGDAGFTVGSDEIDWSPIGGGAAGGATPGEDETPGAVGEGTPTDEGTTPVGGAGGAEEYTTHLVQFDFSASHVAPVFVPGDVDLSQGDQGQFGQVEEIVEQPGGDDTMTGGGAGDPVFVRVSLEDGGAGTGEPGEETPGTPDEETPGEETPGGETPGTPDEETPDGGTPDDEDDGILG